MVVVDPCVSLRKAQVTGSWMIRGVSASRGTGSQETRTVAEPVLRRMEHMLCALDRRRVSRVFLVQDYVLLWERMKRILVNFLDSPFGGAKGKEDKGSGNMNRGWWYTTLYAMPCAMSPKSGCSGCREQTGSWNDGRGSPQNGWTGRRLDSFGASRCPFFG